MFVFGTHVSKHKMGLLATAKIISSLGATAGQIFVGSSIGPLSDKSFNSMMKEAPMAKEYITKTNLRIFIHIPYTLNLAKNESYILEALKKHLTLADAMGATACVIHLGKHSTLSKEEGLSNMYNTISQVAAFMASSSMKTKLCLETSSGAGSELCSKLDELAAFYDRFTEGEKKHIRICIDTAHIHAAGIDIRTPEAVEVMFIEVSERIGLQYIEVIHFNNSAKPFHSRVDRHANLMNGTIPVEGMERFAQLAVQHNIPLILETPAAFMDFPDLHKLAFGIDTFVLQLPDMIEVSFGN